SSRAGVAAVLCATTKTRVEAALAAIASSSRSMPRSGRYRGGPVFVVPGLGQSLSPIARAPARVQGPRRLRYGDACGSLRGRRRDRAGALAEGAWAAREHPRAAFADRRGRGGREPDSRGDEDRPEGGIAGPLALL